MRLNLKNYYRVIYFIICFVMFSNKLDDEKNFLIRFLFSVMLVTSLIYAFDTIKEIINKNKLK